MSILLIICSIAAAHALFWAVVLFGFNGKMSNRLLALLLVMLALRVGKSVMGMVLVGYIFFFSSLGLVSMAFIGPLLYFLIRSLFDSNVKFGIKEYFHFVPGVILLIVTLISHWTYLNFNYYLFTTLGLVYILAAAVYAFRNRTTLKADDLKWRWAVYLLIGVGVIWVTFVLQLLFYDPLVYQLIVITAAIVFYLLSWWAIPRSKLFMADPKKRIAEGHVYEEMGKRIISLLEQEEIFSDPNLTVTKLASIVKAPPYMVSRAINNCFEKSFSELLVYYRIKKSEQLLLADGNKLLTIEAIAYESGFNTLSAFYTSFKKTNKITPAQFRDAHHHTRMKIA